MGEVVTERGMVKVDISEPYSRQRKAEETIKLGGVEWSFAVSLPNSRDEPDLTFTLKCGEHQDSTLWSYDVEGLFLMRNLKFPEKSCRKTLRQTFCYSNQYVDFFQDRRLAELVNPAKGFTEKPGGRCVGIFMEAHLTVTARPGIHRLSAENFRVPHGKLRDAVLTVNGEKLYVCKQMMAMNSSRFYKIYYPPSNTENEENKEDGFEKRIEIKISNVSTREFIGFLDLIHTPGHPIDSDNLEYLLDLCQRFGCKQLLRRIGNELTLKPNVELWRKFEFGEMYKLVELQTACLETFRSLTPKDGDYVMKKLEDVEISSQTRKRLGSLRKLLKEKRRRTSDPKDLNNNF